MVEQGLSFTVIEAPHPLDGEPAEYGALHDLYSARRVWLGSVPGVDWLHDAIESEFGEDRVWYDVKSTRDATHVHLSLCRDCWWDIRDHAYTCCQQLESFVRAVEAHRPDRFQASAVVLDCIRDGLECLAPR